MQPYQERVVAERDELADKFIKLNAFMGGEVFYDISPEERLRLARQSRIMKEYLDILNDRIHAFPAPEPTTVS